MKKRKAIITLLLAVGALTGANAQKQGNNWHFGNAASLNFNTATPTVGTSAYNGAYGIGSNEGVASISDDNGNTLFYTDGQIAYTNTGTVMPNGSGLFGNSSSTQSGIIVPRPGSSTQYYIFTVDAWGGANLIRYNIVDMSLNGGKGDIVSGKKNLPMPYLGATPNHFAEKITAVPKAGGIGFWIIAHLSQETTTNGTFIVWSLGCSSTNDGISEQLVNGSRQSIGKPCTTGPSLPYDVNTLGYMKISPDNSKLAYAAYDTKVEVFNFNNSTGVISNPRSITSNSLNAGAHPYGIEFSPNNNYLYISDISSTTNSGVNSGTIYKYDLLATNIDITASRLIYSIPLTGSQAGNWPSYYGIGALQAGPDGKIYGALQGRDHLLTITNPNSPTPTFTEKGVTLNTGSYSTAGLPNIVTNFLGSAQILTIATPPCGYTISYSGSTNLTNATYFWDFGDGTTSNLQTPNHAYTNTGTFTITLTVTDASGCSIKTKQIINVNNPCGSCIAYNDPKYLKFLNNTTITTNTIWDDKIYINDNVILTVDNAILDITNVDVVFGKNAGIDFKNGAILRANNSVFRPCDMNNIWRGLAFYGTGTIPNGVINECTFKNAKAALEGYNSTSILDFDMRITNNLFANCQAGIALKNVTAKRSITGNTYMIDNKNLAFNTCSSNLLLSTATEYYGINANTTIFIDAIDQNDFIFASNTTLNNAVSNGIYLFNCSNINITTNKFTNFHYGINASSNINLSIEENSFDWSSLFKTALATGNKFQIYVSGSKDILIKSNKIYNSNALNTNANGTPSLTNAGIACHGSKYVQIKQNEITGCEIGISCVGFSNILNPPPVSLGTLNQYIYVAENEINKAWYYGIYMASYSQADITCNKIDMELNTSRDATGIAYYNLFTNTNTNATAIAIRNNCIFNSKNAIYCGNNPNINSTNVNIPKIYNNFAFNYRQYGFENNGFIASSTVSPKEIYHNSFISNNSLSGSVDINTDASHPIYLEANSGIQNSGGNVTLYLNNTAVSTTSCAAQSSNFSNNLTGNNGAQLCVFYSNLPNATNWTPTGKLGLTNDMPKVGIQSQEMFIPKTEDPIHNSNIKLNYYKKESFETYPVPSKDKITINYNIEKAENSYIEIVNLEGKVLKNIQLNYEHTNLDIDISDLANGIYMARLISASESVQYSKIIKE